MDGLTPALLPIMLDVLVGLLLLTLFLFAGPGSSAQARQQNIRRSTRMQLLLGPGVLVLLLLWVLLVIVHPQAGGQSLVPGPLPTHPPIHPTPTPTHPPTPTHTPTPVPSPSVRPKPSPTQKHP
jgi:hypothetical protein